MTTKLHLKNLIFVLPLVWLFSCGVVSEQPIYLAHQLKEDDALTGKWKLYEDGKEGKHSLITVSKEGNHYASLLKTEKGDDLELKLYLFQLKDMTVGDLEIKEKKSEEPPIHTLVWPVFQNKNKLKIIFVNKDVLGEDINQLKHKKEMGTIQITEPSEVVNRFFEERIHQLGLFKEFFWMERVKNEKGK